MTMLRSSSGCKVGWETYDDEQEARQRAAAVVPERERMLSFGYDFGYQWPGTVEETRELNDAGDTISVWTVCVP